MYFVELSYLSSIPYEKKICMVIKMTTFLAYVIVVPALVV